VNRGFFEERQGWHADRSSQMLKEGPRLTGKPNTGVAFFCKDYIKSLAGGADAGRGRIDDVGGLLCDYM